jgi:hypothetical protein
MSDERKVKFGEKKLFDQAICGKIQAKIKICSGNDEGVKKLVRLSILEYIDSADFNSKNIL